MTNKFKLAKERRRGWEVSSPRLFQHTLGSNTYYQCWRVPCSNKFVAGLRLRSLDVSPTATELFRCVCPCRKLGSFSGCCFLTDRR